MKIQPPSPRLRAGLVLILLACLLAGCRQAKQVEPQQGATSAAPPAAQNTVERTLLYPAGDDMLLSGVQVQLPSTGDPQRDMAEVVKRYLAGPPGDGQFQPFPDHSGLRALFLMDGKDVAVDLTGPVRSGAGSDTETARVYGIVDTLALNFSGVRSVRILVDGQEVDTLLGHLDLSMPIPPEPRMMAAPLRGRLAGAGDAQP